MRPVMEFAKHESKRLGSKVYPAHTVYGDVELGKWLEALLANYAQADGWFGPLSNDAMRAILLRFKNEGASFLEEGPLP
jgi:hypothetical protein